MYSTLVLNSSPDLSQVLVSDITAGVCELCVWSLRDHPLLECVFTPISNCTAPLSILLEENLIVDMCFTLVTMW